HPDSGRLGRIARAATQQGYAALNGVGAIAEADAERLRDLGVDPARITITGDPRFDAVLDSVDAVADDDPVRTLADPDFTLVAASTWPDDEALLLAAFAAIRQSRPAARLILAPHEPTAEALARIERTALSHGLERPVPFSILAAGSEPSLVVLD